MVIPELSRLGVHAGTLVHVFRVVTYVGGGYLIYLGVRRLLDRSSPLAPGARRAPRLRRAFVDGFVVNVLNPKTALFFVAFLPPARWLRGHPSFVRGERWISGTIYIGLGVAATAAHRGRS
jgi:threonine/homoserine/homoserine lactone efflux protein